MVVITEDLEVKTLKRPIYTLGGNKTLIYSSEDIQEGEYHPYYIIRSHLTKGPLINLYTIPLMYSLGSYNSKGIKVIFKYRDKYDPIKLNTNYSSLSQTLLGPHEIYNNVYGRRVLNYIESLYLALEKSQYLFNRFLQIKKFKYD